MQERKCSCHWEECRRRVAPTGGPCDGLRANGLSVTVAAFTQIDVFRACLCSAELLRLKAGRMFASTPAGEYAV